MCARGVEERLQTGPGGRGFGQAGTAPDTDRGRIQSQSQLYGYPLRSQEGTAMKRILVPTHGPEDWKHLLAQPDRHWKAGYSAMALAHCWEAAKGEFPPEVAGALKASRAPELENLELLLAIPEFQVQLDGGARPSQTDLLVLARGGHGLVCIAIEGKVAEDFGPTLAAKRTESDGGVPARLAQLHRVLDLPNPLPGEIRYQLLHRTAAALLAAEKFAAATAVMLVHSFSPNNAHFEDFKAFAEHLGVRAEVGVVHPARRESLPNLFIGWCRGSERFLAPSASNAV